MSATASRPSASAANVAARACSRPAEASRERRLCRLSIESAAPAAKTPRPASASTRDCRLLVIASRGLRLALRVAALQPLVLQRMLVAHACLLYTSPSPRD